MRTDSFPTSEKGGIAYPFLILRITEGLSSASGHAFNTSNHIWIINASSTIFEQNLMLSSDSEVADKGEHTNQSPRNLPF